MLVAVAVVVLLVLVIVALVVARRPGKGDLGSVERYHTAVSTLEHMPDRVGRTPLRIVEPAAPPPGTDASRRAERGPDDGGPSDPGGSGSDPTGRGPDPAGGRSGPSGAPGWSSEAGGRVPPVRVRGSEQFPDPETPLVFDDARPVEPRRGDLPPGPTSPPRASRSQRHALDAMNHGNRRRTTLALVGLVVVVFVVLAVIGSHHTPTHPSAAGTGAGRTTRTTTGSSPAQGSVPPHRPAPSTTTTLPSRLTPTASAGGAAYTVPAAPFTLTIAATSPSWISVTSAATGSSVFAGLVPAGGHQAVTGAGSLDVLVGAPGITLSVNRIPVVLPTPFHTPSTLSFVVAGASGATATTAPPTTAPPTTAPATTTSTTSPAGTGSAATSP